MIPGDDLFIPRMLKGEIIKGWVRRTKDFARVIDFEIIPCSEKDLVI
jgi:hypothetical protein